MGGNASLGASLCDVHHFRGILSPFLAAQLLRLIRAVLTSPSRAGAEGDRQCGGDSPREHLQRALTPITCFSNTVYFLARDVGCKTRRSRVPWMSLSLDGWKKPRSQTGLSTCPQPGTLSVEAVELVHMGPDSSASLGGMKGRPQVSPQGRWAQSHPCTIVRSCP